jgi:para-nitrobenzyl esterase
MKAGFGLGVQRKSRFAAVATATLGAAFLVLAAPVWSQDAAARPNCPPAAPAPTPTGKASVVKIASGQVEGLLFGDIAVYRGIPSAAPPVGDLRWRAPQPAAAWKDAREATAFG